MWVKDKKKKSEDFRLNTRQDLKMTYMTNEELRTVTEQNIFKIQDQ